MANDPPSISVEFRPPWTVNLTYFKESGKYYSEGTCHSYELQMYEVIDGVRAMLDKGTRPGLVDCKPGENEFYVVIRVKNHPHDYPALIIPKQYQKEHELKRVK